MLFFRMGGELRKSQQSDTMKHSSACECTGNITVLASVLLKRKNRRNRYEL